MKNLEFYEPGLGYSDIYERAKNYFKKPGVFNKSKHRLRVGIPDEYYFDFDMIINDLLQMKDVIFLYTNIIKEIEKQHPVKFREMIKKGVKSRKG